MRLDGRELTNKLYDFVSFSFDNLNTWALVLSVFPSSQFSSVSAYINWHG